MTSNSTEYAAGKEHDATWQLHSSTDSYLNWALDSNDKMTPPTTRYREADSSTNPSPKTMQPALLGPMTPPPFAIPSPMASSATDSSSMISLHGHVASPERATSPSYFAKLYNHGQSRSKNPTSPSITFSTAMTDSKNDAKTSPRSPIPSDAQADRTSTTTQKYTSLLPSPPGTQRVVDSESTGKSRRPSSVFEHVGNVWERFGRKVHNARTSTSEQANASSSLSRRSASQISAATTSAAESTEAFESHRMSSSSSSQSQASPSQLTYLDTSDQASSPNLPLAGSLDYVRQPTSAVNRTDTVASSNAGTSEDDNPEGLSYLAAAPQLGLTSQTGSSYAQNTMPGHRRTSSAFDRVLIQVTDDNERFSVVDISGVHSADAIKERMLAKLHLFDVDFSGLQLFRTEVGQSEATGHIVNDDALLVLCLQMGDDRGTLKFLVQQTGPQPNSSGRAMPPPVSSGGTPGMNVTPRRPSTNGSSASQRLRSGSQSSRSSVNDQIAYTDPFASSEESSNRNSGSSLTRTKAQTRRGHSSANPSEEGRSPVQSSLAYQTSQDRRSIASSSDSPAHDRNARSDMLRNVASEAGLGVKAGTATGPQPSGGVNGRRSSQTELARKRMEEDSGPQRLLNTTSNQRSQRLERSDEGSRDPQRPNGGPSLMLHNTKSMDDLRPPDSSRLSDAAVHHELKLHPSFDRDGRYPDPAIMRPATAAPSTSRESNSGHRQYSSEAQSGNGAFGSMPSQSDPRILTRNRSAQAALPGGSQMNVQGPQQAPQLRSPSLPNQYAVADPRYARNGHNEDPRYGASVGYSSHTAPTRSGNGSSRPQQSAPPTYSYPNLPFQQPSRMSVPSAGYMNEFGARSGQSQPFNTYHGHDPRLVNSRQGPPPPRPYSIHEQGPYPRPFPQQSPQPPPGFLPREDPFTNRYFPASSSRQVSEFQLKAGHLQPGMTVQETLRAKTPAPSGNPYGPQYPSGPSYGPRDPRQGGPTQVYQGQPNPASMQHRQSQTQLHQQHVQQQQQARQQQQQQQMHPHELQHHHQRHSQHQDHPSSHSQMPSRIPYERSSSLMATSPPNTQSQPSTARASQYQTSLNGAGSEPHSRQSTSRPNTSERSSGSSFSNHSSSHGRHHSAEDDRRGRGSMEESFSAPTSTRSSHSSTTPVKTPDQDTRRSFPSARREGDLGDDELAHIRPLPQPPGPTSSAQRRATSQDRSSQPLARKSEEEDTLRAGEWASLWKSLDNNSGGTVSGTAISGSSGGDGDTLRADSATPGLMSQTGGETITPEIRARMQRAHSVSLPPEDNGTIASFGTFDDDESESGTWAQPLDSDVDAPRLPLQFPDDRESYGGDRDSQGGDTLQPGAASVLATSASNLRRPELRLTIDPATGPTQMPSSSRHSGGSPMPVSGLLSSGSTGVTRSNSFAQTDSDWAFRPPPEQLYENLDNFFPKHDLDKPLLDTAAVPEGNVVSSPRSESSPVAAPGPASTLAAAASQQQQLLGLRGRHKKSIRLVAQDRKRFLDKTEDCPSSQEPDVSSGLLRRRSTKLWGTKVIEMTPGQEVAAPASAVSAESPSSESSARPVFKWVKGDLIGKGTYGRVYLALNATTGEMIAVKQVELPRTASDREDSRQKGVVAALKSEIETLKDLDHPHIVSYLGFEETQTFLSIFLEYVPGGSVGSCLRKHGKFEEQTIKSFLHQILEGLAYLHSKGILHRDLKADNILVDFGGVCKISDFGTVRRSDDIYGNVENMSLQGSIFWMAPEVVSLSKKGYSAKVDIWSLGCVVLEMFAGRRPWSEDEAVQAMFKIGAERKAPPIPADVKLSKQAAHFLRNCFEVDPAKRPTAQRLLDHVFTVTQPEWRFQQSALFRSLHR